MNTYIVHPATEEQEKALKAVFEALGVSFQNVEESSVSEEPAKYQERISGLAKGLIEMREDFDEPLDDFKDYQ